MVLAQSADVSAGKFVNEPQRALPAGRSRGRAQGRHTVEEIVEARSAREACRRRAFVAVGVRRRGSGEVRAVGGFDPRELSIILRFCVVGNTRAGIRSALPFPTKVSVVKHLFTVGV